MDYQQYETYHFYQSHAFNVATGMEGRSYRHHWHSYGEIIKTGPGDVNVYRVNQTTYNLEENDLVLIWPMEQHEIIDADRKDAVIIQFSNAFAQSMYDLPRIMRYYHDVHVIRAKSHPELSARLGSLVDRMKEIYYAQGIVSRESRGCMLLLDFFVLLDRFRNEFSSDPDRDRYSGVSDDTVKRITEVSEYVKNNLAGEDVSQGAMADRAGLSREYFSRIFKVLSGSNYSKWLNMIRVDHAISLLPQSDMKLTEIAMLSGFQSIPSFNRVFKELKGISPSEYRNIMGTD